MRNKRAAFVTIILFVVVRLWPPVIFKLVNKAKNQNRDIIYLSELLTLRKVASCSWIS